MISELIKSKLLIANLQNIPSILNFTLNIIIPIIPVPLNVV